MIASEVCTISEYWGLVADGIDTQHQIVHVTCEIHDCRIGLSAGCPFSKRVTDVHVQTNETRYQVLNLLKKNPSGSHFISVAACPAFVVQCATQLRALTA